MQLLGGHTRVFMQSLMLSLISNPAPAFIRKNSHADNTATWHAQAEQALSARGKRAGGPCHYTAAASNTAGPWSTASVPIPPIVTPIVSLPIAITLLRGVATIGRWGVVCCGRGRVVVRSRGWGRQRPGCRGVSRRGRRCRRGCSCVRVCPRDLAGVRLI